MQKCEFRVGDYVYQKGIYDPQMKVIAITGDQVTCEWTKNKRTDTKVFACNELESASLIQYN
jgi:uncharacterized protein YodC (DUF2158 family)